jgi:adhesin/invasin
LASQSVTITNTGSFTITATNTASTEAGTSVSFTVGSATLNNFLVEKFGGGAIGTQVAGTAFNIRLTARDAYNNTVTGFTGTADLTSTGTLTGSPLTSSAFTSGVLASQSVTITNTGSFTLTATNTASTEAGTSVSFTVDAGTSFLPFASTIVVTEDTAVADGVSTLSIIVQLRDAFGNNLAISAGVITLTTTLGTLSAVTDNLDGTYGATLVSTIAGSSLIRGTLDGVALLNTATGVFVPGAASAIKSTINTSLTTLPADGTSTTLITVRLKDAQNNPLTTGGDTVTLTTTAGTLSGLTDLGNGKYTAQLTAGTTAGSAIISGKLNGVTLTATTSVLFTAELTWVSLMTITPNEPTVDEEVTYGAMAVDANGFPLTYTWEFGDGSKDTGSSTTHRYTLEGVYTVSVTAKNGAGSSLTQTAQLTVSAKEGSGTGPKTLSKIKTSGLVRGTIQDGDVWLLSATLPNLPSGSASAGTVVVVEFGGAKVEFKLGLNGRAKSQYGSLQFGKTVASKAKTSTSSSIKVRILRGAWAAQWKAAGFDFNQTMKNKTMVLPVSITLGSVKYVGSVEVISNATAGKEARFRSQ